MGREWRRCCDDGRGGVAGGEGPQRYSDCGEGDGGVKEERANEPSTLNRLRSPPPQRRIQLALNALQQQPIAVQILHHHPPLQKHHHTTTHSQ